ESPSFSKTPIIRGKPYAGLKDDIVLDFAKQEKFIIDSYCRWTQTNSLPTLSFNGSFIKGYDLIYGVLSHGGYKYMQLEEWKSYLREIALLPPEDPDVSGEDNSTINNDDKKIEELRQRYDTYFGKFEQL
ncbi:hypothetical protein WA158_005330, partial [Blastocystis sp. Blastoise]